VTGPTSDSCNGSGEETDVDWPGSGYLFRGREFDVVTRQFPPAPFGTVGAANSLLGFIAHPIKIIIDVTSTGDIKTRSRWSRALRYAWRERKTWRDLRTFLRENGGPAGCAKQFAAINSRRKCPGCIVYRCPRTGRPYLIVHEAI
jgi:hypothetical protein